MYYRYARLHTIPIAVNLSIWMDLIIPGVPSFIKPDLKLEMENTVLVMDVSVVSGYRMEETWRIKVDKYGSPPNSEAIQSWRNSCKPVKHLPILFSNRGLLYEASAVVL